MNLPKNGKMILTVASLILGILFISLLKATGATGSTARTDTTLASLIQTGQENEQLKNDITKLKEELAKFQEGQNASKVVLEQLETAKRNAGLTKVTGPGIRITLDDAPNRDINNEDINYYLIHEEYIRQIINSLWSGGAEAIAVNGQRIIGSTEIFCSGAFIQIGQTRQMPPYVIEAVGDVNYLQSALNFYFWDRLGEYQQQYGITRKLEVPTEPLVIPAGKTQQFRYSEPMKEAK
ncbi:MULTISPECIES: DUF881 domain-containing protein [Desulfitobacterium]|uniref:DUF881 domain-containing protein n=2 Tax=Desulfitobacterium dehalogenans TaxID=36854 RepID=I4A3S4_DESDJ|nr:MULTISPECIES: DUF881 domain-containing protein [Desulfitobacterium]AFL98608.1 hypothetical protein Desde_0115 [Desulfitobacterium dehalogenans ATCC 51507]HHY28650.1 DUF881 domain-containing protein [Desulfitobacterium dehalogenans]